MSRFPYDKQQGGEGTFGIELSSLSAHNKRAIGELLIQPSATGEQVMTYRNSWT